MGDEICLALLQDELQYCFTRWMSLGIGIFNPYQIVWLVFSSFGSYSIRGFKYRQRDASMPNNGMSMMLVPLCICASVMMGSTNDTHASEHKLFVSFSYRGGLEAYVESKGFTYLPVIYQHSIDKNKDSKLDSENFAEHVNSRFRDYRGPVSIDWEGRATWGLRGPDIPKEKVDALVSEFLKAVNTLKRASPLPIEVGFFGFPSRLSTHLERTVSEVHNMRDVYKNIEVIFPSLYLRRNDPIASSSINFIEAHLKDVLRETCQYNKKIYGFISHRWVPGSRFTPLSLVPLEVFEDYIRTIKSVSYQGCRLNGVVWWGADEYWYKSGRRKEIAQSLNEYSSMDEYAEKELSLYATIIKKYFGQ
jgi:hypothetical protein